MRWCWQWLRPVADTSAWQRLPPRTLSSAQPGFHLNPIVRINSVIINYTSTFIIVDVIIIRNYPVYMQLLGYAHGITGAHGITVIIPSDISPDMFGTRSCR